MLPKSFKIIIFLLVITLTNKAQNYSGGSGTIADPYLIANKADLKFLSENSGEWSKSFKQTANIFFTTPDFQNGGDFYNGGEGFIPIGFQAFFNGSYDGGGYTIDSLYINRPNENYIGFFAFTNTYDFLGNIKLTNISITGRNYTGGLIGYAYGNFEINNSYVSGIITGIDNVGGIVGGCYQGSIVYCHTDGSVNGYSFVGGIAGSTYDDTVKYCFSTANVPAILDQNGGLIGYASYTYINDSYATGTVSGNDKVGGIVGYAIDGQIFNSYSTGAVSGNNNVGGFIGSATGGSSSAIGSFWDTQTSGQATSISGTGKTTIEMQTQTTFTTEGWDFIGEATNGTNDIWYMPACSDGNYPILAWQMFSGATGPNADTLLIATKTDLKNLSENSCLWTGNYKQTADITFSPADFQSGGDFYNSGNGCFTIGNNSVAFSGSYDGQVHSIENLYMNNPPNSSYTGLFGRGSNTSVITNINLKNLDITSGYGAGGICGFGFGTISNCSTSGTITSNYSSGGIVANYNGGIMSNCYSSVDVISQFLFTGTNLDNNSTQKFISEDETFGTSGTGGLIGSCYNATITNCYSRGLVNGVSALGGLIGTGSSNQINHCFWDMQTSAQSNSAGGYGKTTLEMQTQATFTDSLWDFIIETTNGTNDIWKMGQCTNNGYPIFSWQTAAPFPQINSTLGDTICGTGQLNLNASAGGAVAQWYDSATGGTLLSSGNNFITPLLSDTLSYWVEADSAGCLSLTRTEVVAVVNALPDASTLLNAETITANAIGVTYQWIDCDNGNAMIAGETNQSYTATANGNYAVIVNNGDCSDTSACINIATIGLKDSYTINQGIVYPNPNSGIFTVNALQNSEIEILNVLGDIIYSTASNNAKTFIDIHEQNSGVYLVRIKNKTENTVFRIVKQ